MLSCPVSLSCATAQLSSAALGPLQGADLSLWTWLSRHLGRCWVSPLPLILIKFRRGRGRRVAEEREATNKWWGISDSTSP